MNDDTNVYSDDFVYDFITDPKRYSGIDWKKFSSRQISLILTNHPKMYKHFDLNKQLDPYDSSWLVTLHPDIAPNINFENWSSTNISYVVLNKPILAPYLELDKMSPNEWEHIFSRDPSLEELFIHDYVHSLMRE